MNEGSQTTVVDTTTTTDLCLARLEDDHVTGLPAICTLDKGHGGTHAESRGAGGIEWPQTSSADAHFTPKSTCPDWCQRDHSRDDERWRYDVRAAEMAGVEISEEWLRETQECAYDLHEGPTFGLIEIDNAGGTSPTGEIVQGAGDLTADELRELAADALAAAEWLEAHQ